MTLLAEAVGLLSAATAEKVEPAEARTRVEALRDRHPGAALRLLWQREEYDGSLHYDLLVREPATDAGVVSLSWCPDDALPWPLRGVQRGGEMLLVRVNGVELEVADAIGFLDVLWREAPLRDRLVDTCLVREVLDAGGEELDDAALQDAADAFRRARGLLTAEATREWMRRERLSDRQFEDLVVHQAQVARLRERVTAGRVDAELTADSHRYDQLRLVRVEHPDAAAAARLARLTEAPDLLAAAAADFAAGSGPAPALVTVTRADLGPELAEAVAGNGPVPLGDRFLVASVLGVRPATREAVSRRLFADWLAERRAEARIEWNWGPRG
ncbi:TIGR04500 family putative peptide maturation system protein [Dactylosporangium sp. NPDC000555]|uniref:TIGR04500 family putative peptide maturation system protein n=1 Tax=Dactylosporangium sp. NPDC000555 TaxID=3154260 RepID=UPI0033199183